MSYCTVTMVPKIHMNSKRCVVFSAFLICSLTSTITGCYGLAASSSAAAASAATPNLKTLASAVYKTKLNYRIAVGNKETPFQMKDMHVELSSTLKTPPGGSSRTTGIHDAALLSYPYYINEDGEQFVALERGGWELQWSKSSPHGFLVVSFVTPETVQRNNNNNNKDAAQLTKGRFFMYHRVWTRESLTSERERRKLIQSEAAKLLDDRDSNIRDITDNDHKSNLDKVVSYARAAKSMNEYRTSGMKEAVYIPLYDNQVLELTNDCIVSTRGLIYKDVTTTRRTPPAYLGESRVDFLDS